MIKTDLQVKIPDGCYGLIAPCSSLAYRFSVDVGAGVIDPDYRGNLGILLINNGEGHFSVSKGDAIAQLILEVYCIPKLEECKQLPSTQRDRAGFGFARGV